MRYLVSVEKRLSVAFEIDADVLGGRAPPRLRHYQVVERITRCNGSLETVAGGDCLRLMVCAGGRKGGTSDQENECAARGPNRAERCPRDIPNR